MTKTLLSKADILARAKDLQWKFGINIKFSEDDLKRHYQIATSRIPISENEINFLIKKLRKGIEIYRIGYEETQKGILRLVEKEKGYCFKEEVQSLF